MHIEQIVNQIVDHNVTEVNFRHMELEIKIIAVVVSKPVVIRVIKVKIQGATELSDEQKEVDSQVVKPIDLEGTVVEKIIAVKVAVVKLNCIQRRLNDYLAIDELFEKTNFHVTMPKVDFNKHAQKIQVIFIDYYVYILGEQLMQIAEAERYAEISNTIAIIYLNMNVILKVVHLIILEHIYKICNYIVIYNDKNHNRVTSVHRI